MTPTRRIYTAALKDGAGDVINTIEDSQKRRLIRTCEKLMQDRDWPNPVEAVDVRGPDGKLIYQAHWGAATRKVIIDEL